MCSCAPESISGSRDGLSFLTSFSVDHTSGGSGLDEFDIFLMGINGVLLGRVSSTDGFLVSGISKLLLFLCFSSIGLGPNQNTVSLLHGSLSFSSSSIGGIGESLSGVNLSFPSSSGSSSLGFGSSNESSLFSSNLSLMGLSGNEFCVPLVLGSKHLGGVGRSFTVNGLSSSPFSGGSNSHFLGGGDGLGGDTLGFLGIKVLLNKSVSSFSVCF